jgi:hypothetical protein
MECSLLVLLSRLLLEMDPGMALGGHAELELGSYQYYTSSTS